MKEKNFLFFFIRKCRSAPKRLMIFIAQATSNKKKYLSIIKSKGKRRRRSRRNSKVNDHICVCMSKCLQFSTNGEEKFFFLNKIAGFTVFILFYFDYYHHHQHPIAFFYVEYFCRNSYFVLNLKRIIIIIITSN